MSGSFTIKQIRLTFTLGKLPDGTQPTFDGKNNTKIVEGLRVICHIKKSGQPAKNECKLQVFGMLPEDMRQLSTLGYNPRAIRKNFIQVEAGDSDGLATVYQGEITGAWINYHRPPDLYFEVHAVTGYYAANAPAPPTSVKGSVAASTLFAKLAKTMGYTFADGGVTGMITNPYFGGSAFDQAQQLAKAVGCDFGVDDAPGSNDAQGTLFIQPRGTVRKNLTAYTSPTTGLKDYPIFDKKGLEAEMIFNPFVQLGGQLQIEGSAVQQANAFWRVLALEHTLVSRNHTHANWITKAHCSRIGSS